MRLPNPGAYSRGFLGPGLQDFQHRPGRKKGEGSGGEGLMALPKAPKKRKKGEGTGGEGLMALPKAQKKGKKGRGVGERT
jgi:hypothetical protein